MGMERCRRISGRRLRCLAAWSTSRIPKRRFSTATASVLLASSYVILPCQTKIQHLGRRSLTNPLQEVGIKLNNFPPNDEVLWRTHSEALIVLTPLVGPANASTISSPSSFLVASARDRIARYFGIKPKTGWASGSRRETTYFQT